MQYLLLIYEAEEIWAGRSDAGKREVMQGHQALNERLRADGVHYNGQPLMPTATAVSVRVRDGRRQVTDGPFAETKEQLAGFYLVDVATLDEALDYAALIPNAGTGVIEVRPVADHSGHLDG
ncbi:MAG: YciI family protein [Pseudomonadales bacterium]|nr:YciI family protein [Pseudomonadales bacterium]MCP5182878.1 YciI family protein [Pseudomonadales bacterium]